MSRVKDLTGMKFGRLTVVEFADLTKTKQARWLCRCDCGNEKIYRANDLKRWKTPTCGCFSNAIDLIGHKYNRWTVIERVFPNTNQGSTQWLCRCDCGNTAIVPRNNLRSGASKSCGCWNLENIKEMATTHGKTKTREYEIWSGMKKRCLNPNSKAYSYYGGRGIKICDSWKNDFTAFLTDMGPCPANLELDRIGNNGNYEPGNCRWATRKEQMQNTSRNVWIEFCGKRMVQTDWIRDLGITGTSWHYWKKRGMPDQEVIARYMDYQGPRKIGSKNRNVLIDGERE